MAGNPDPTTDFFTLPARSREIRQVSTSSQTEAPHPILVVEDEVLLRLDLADQLRRSGFHVIEADSADEAVALLEHMHITTIVTDLRMPGSIDGRELVIWTRRRFPNVKIIVVSAHAEPFGQAAPDAILSKPVRFERLLQTLRQISPPAEPT